MLRARARVIRAAVALVAAAAVTVGAIVLVTGDSGSERAQPSASTTTSTATTGPATTTSTTLPAVDARLVWSDCGGGFECGTVDAPVDWSAPTGEKVALAVIRHRADVPAARIGTLVVNCGGPGHGCVSYLRLALARIPAAVKNRFDILAWDPRGTGGSRPIDCVDDATLDRATDLTITPRTDADWNEIHSYNADYARGCTQRNGVWATLVGTRNTVRDLEQIRRALGEPTISYLGYSYGTLIGVVYADMYPTSIRAMVLDGSADWWLPPLDSSRLQAKAFFDALQAFLSYCETTTGCALRAAGNPRTVFASLAMQSVQSPLAGSYTAQGVTRTGRVTEWIFDAAVLGSMYDDRYRPTLANALAAAARGDGGPLLQMSDTFVGRNPDGTWKADTEANAVISCLDRAIADTRTEAQERADTTRFAEEFPPFGANFSGIGCVGMPKARPGEQIGEITVADLAPSLIVGTTGDPATPYPGTEAMAKRITGSRVLTYDAVGHTAFGTARSNCVDDHVARYLVELTLPPPDARC